MGLSTKKNKTAIITGASKGIGLSVAHYFAKKNYDLLLISRDKEALIDIQNNISLSHPTVDVSIAPIDITDESTVNHTINSFYHVKKQIDVVFNNAGYVKRGTSDISSIEIQKMVSVNIQGSINIIRAVSIIMKKQSYGYIINMSSRNAKTPRSFLGGYAATKAALLAFNESLYKELSEYGIKVTALVPGFVDTAMTSDLDLPRESLIQTDEFGKFLDLILSLSSSVALKEICFEATPQIGKYP